MRILRPRPHVLGFYDGRDGKPRRHAEKNWYDDGAMELGICSYAVVDGGEALVYDTQASIEQAWIVRRALEREGVRRMTVVLSHWHADHVAGNVVFADCEIVANAATRDALHSHRDELEHGLPVIDPLVMPTTIFEGSHRMLIGALDVELRHLDIHSADATVVLLPGGTLLAGDTLEDPITYVAEPERLAIHLADLRAMRGWAVEAILPNHGSAETIASGGYNTRLIDATIRYVEDLLSKGIDYDEPSEALLHFIAVSLEAGGISYHPAYEDVHRRNLRLVQALGGWKKI
jgi:cyclase